MYIPRELTRKLKQSASEFPIVALVGPRQSGKSTLVQHAFPHYQYVSLENLDTREFAQSDPRGFLSTYARHVIIDEAQRAPDLFSYLQGWVDTAKQPGQYILTGSQHFLLHEKVSQSLAGRVAVLALLPLSVTELKSARLLGTEYEHHLFKGFYPALYDKKVSLRDWYANYIQTYVERDVRQIKQIADLAAFQKFVNLCAGRVGQLLNLSALANDCGVSHNTIKSWLSVLEASFIIFLLQPHHKNFKKRLVKMPKLYFYDPGLAASLLGVETPEQLRLHHLKGSLFESFMIGECLKYRLNQGLPANCFFWRDKVGHEIDCLIDAAGQMTAVEIKSGKTVAEDFFRDLAYWGQLARAPRDNLFVVYGGGEDQQRTQARVISWMNLEKVFHHARSKHYVEV